MKKHSGECTLHPTYSTNCEPFGIDSYIPSGLCPTHVFRGTNSYFVHGGRQGVFLNCCETQQNITTLLMMVQRRNGGGGETIESFSLWYHLIPSDVRLYILSFLPLCSTEIHWRTGYNENYMYNGCFDALGVVHRWGRAPTHRNILQRCGSLYHMQLLEQPQTNGKYAKGIYCFVRFGKVGEAGRYWMEGPYNPDDAIKCFKRKFRTKFKCKWDKREEILNKPLCEIWRRYALVEMHFLLKEY